MPPRRKTRLQITEFGDEDTGFACDDGPILSGDGSIGEDLVCGQCLRTIFLALSRDAVFDELAKSGCPLTDRHGLRHPFVAKCDCGAVNRVWPPPLD
jgi:hypothetical protein